MSGTNKQFHLARAALSRCGRTPITAVLAALGFAVTVLSAFAQDSGSFYRPLTLAPADGSSSGRSGQQRRARSQGRN